MLLIKINSNVRRKVMELCCTYIETNKFEEVVSFYENCEDNYDGKLERKRLKWI